MWTGWKKNYLFFEMSRRTSRVAFKTASSELWQIHWERWLPFTVMELSNSWKESGDVIKPSLPNPPLLEASRPPKGSCVQLLCRTMSKIELPIWLQSLLWSDKVLVAEWVEDTAYTSTASSEPRGKLWKLCASVPYFSNGESSGGYIYRTVPSHL